jgi:hypothetical protein
MKLFTVKLTDEERASLEVARARLGLRSQADVIRLWIAEFDVVPSDHPSRTRWTDEEAAKIKAGAIKHHLETSHHVVPPMDQQLAAAKVVFGSAKPAPGSRLKKDKK